MQVRINKYLSDKKICSRRKADKLIQEGKVLVNGKKASLGQKIDPSKDKVEIEGGHKNIKRKYRYYLFHKPRGVLSHKLKSDDIDAVLLAGLNPEEFAVVGRLDKDSEGLLLITNDGRIVNRLLNPEFAHEREYIVVADKFIKNQAIKALEKGVKIENYKTKPAKVEKIDANTIKIILTEGKKHQIRRMLAALGYQTKRLKRTRIMNLKLGNLKAGEKAQIKQGQLRAMLSKLGL